MQRVIWGVSRLWRLYTYLDYAISSKGGIFSTNAKKKTLNFEPPSSSSSSQGLLPIHSVKTSLHTNKETREQSKKQRKYVCIEVCMYVFMYVMHVLHVCMYVFM